MFGTESAVEQNIRVTYGALGHQVETLAGALAAAGVCRGDRVGIALPNGLPMFVSCLAAAVPDGRSGLFRRRRVLDAPGPRLRHRCPGV